MLDQKKITKGIRTTVKVKKSRFLVSAKVIQELPERGCSLIGSGRIGTFRVGE
jgi:hypothetical protein